MTVTQPTTAADLTAVTVDLYRDIHKGIRTELFAVTEQAGRLDPAEPAGRADLAARVRSLVEQLQSHAEHEDTHVQPAIEAHLPEQAERIASDHERIEARMVDLEALADATVDETRAAQRLAVHRLYLELGSFTGAYLEHQDVEERTVMPALEAAIGPEAALAIHQAIIAGIPPDEMARSLAIMLPAMNLEDRVELLGGMRAGAPAEVFEGVWGLAGSVLTAPDHGALAARLGIA
ncbi:MAG: hemerythrin domain-containing protein [Acidimicrobiia bacterium]|nr:hemerythrin domain-containing protein [Acidimicrobiia bacterium]